MRLEPVYLVAPEPEPPRVTRRAAILGMVGAFVFGVVSGVIGASRFTSRGVPESPAVTSEEERLLEWVRPYALGATTDEQLLVDWSAVLQAVVLHVEEHPELWGAPERLARLVVDRRVRDRETERLIALRVLSMIDGVGGLSAPTRVRQFERTLRNVIR